MIHPTSEQRVGNRHTPPESASHALSKVLGRLVDRFFEGANLPLVPGASSPEASAVAAATRSEDSTTGLINFMSVEGVGPEEPTR